MDSSTALKRTLGPIALIIYGVGDILGAGIYGLTGKVAGVAGEQAWLAFACAMGVAALTAGSYAEFAARHPHSGGAAYFLTRVTRRPSVPLMIGWLVLCSGIVSMAAGSRAFTGYLRSIAPVLPEQLIIVLFAMGVAGIAFWGIRESSATNIVCTAVEGSGLLIVLFTGLAYIFSGATPAETGGSAMSIATELPPIPFSWAGIAGGAALAFYAFIGFEDLVNIAEEVKEPRRNLPLAILVAISVTGSFYVLIGWVATSVLRPEVLGASEAPLLDVVRTAAPSVPPLLFTIIALFAVTNTALLNCIMGSRLIYGLSRERLLPKTFSTIHPRTHTPHFGVLAVLMGVILLGLTGTIQGLAGTTSTLLLLVFAAVHVALLLVKRKEPGHKGFQVPAVVPILGLVSCLVLIVFAQGVSLRAGAFLIGLGVLLVVWRGVAVRGGSQVMD